MHIIIHCSAYCLSIDQSLLKLGSALLPLNVFVAGLSSSPLLRGRKILSACPMITSCLNDLCHVSPACLALSPSSVVDPTVLQSWTSALMSKLFQSLMLANLKHCWHLLPIGAQLPLPLYYGLVSKTLTYMSFSDLLGSITVYYLICIGHIIENIHKMANKQRRCTRSIRTAHEIFILIGMWVCVCVCSFQIQVLTIKKQPAVQYDGPPYLSVYQNTYTQALSMNMTYYKCMLVFFLIMHQVDHLKKKTSNCTGMWCKNTKTVSSHHNRCHSSWTHHKKEGIWCVCRSCINHTWITLTDFNRNPVSRKQTFLCGQTNMSKARVTI